MPLALLAPSPLGPVAGVGTFSPLAGRSRDSTSSPPVAVTRTSHRLRLEAEDLVLLVVVLVLLLLLSAVSLLSLSPPALGSASAIDRGSETPVLRRIRHEHSPDGAPDVHADTPPYACAWSHSFDCRSLVLASENLEEDPLEEFACGKIGT